MSNQQSPYLLLAPSQRHERLWETSSQFQPDLGVCPYHLPFSNHGIPVNNSATTAPTQFPIRQSFANLVAYGGSSPSGSHLVAQPVQSTTFPAASQSNNIQDTLYRTAWDGASSFARASLTTPQGNNRLCVSGSEYRTCDQLFDNRYTSFSEDPLSQAQYNGFSRLPTSIASVFAPNPSSGLSLTSATIFPCNDLETTPGQIGTIYTGEAQKFPSIAESSSNVNPNPPATTGPSGTARPRSKMGRRSNACPLNLNKDRQCALCVKRGVQCRRGYGQKRPTAPFALPTDTTYSTHPGIVNLPQPTAPISNYIGQPSPPNPTSMSNSSIHNPQLDAPHGPYNVSL
ncbi:hypothetical protein DL93DRAFT_2227707 [Clavulina sp. PMI_390]|nr:hypothetical protein DL93DRAFT_2227707 [Clavulina sp. PMI_390]